MPLGYIARPRTFPEIKKLPEILREQVAKMKYSELQETALKLLEPENRYHSCNNCLMCAAVAELIERVEFDKYEPQIVKQIVEG